MSLKFNMEISNNLEKDAKKIAKEVLRRSMIEIQNLSKIYAPVDTSNLRNSIELISIRDDMYIINVFAPYAYYVEYGTWKMKAQPYLRPALDEVKFKKIEEIRNQVISNLQLTF